MKGQLLTISLLLVFGWFAVPLGYVWACGQAVENWDDMANEVPMLEMGGGFWRMMMGEPPQISCTSEVVGWTLYLLYVVCTIFGTNRIAKWWNK